MKFKKVALAILTGLSFSILAEVDLDTQLLKKAIGGSEIKSIKMSKIPGVYEVQVDGNIFYVGKNGKYIISGDMYDLENNKSITNVALSKIRLEQMAEIKDIDKIVFKAENEKYVVNVFTDITCPYCTKLHNEIPEYNKRGITIKYLAFPRTGPGSKSFNDMQSVWCSEDRKKALTDAEVNHKVIKNECGEKQVATQFAKGVEVGVNGTPAIVLSNGELLPGYLSADDLLRKLELSIGKK